MQDSNLPPFLPPGVLRHFSGFIGVILRHWVHYITVFVGGCFFLQCRPMIKSSVSACAIWGDFWALKKFKYSYIHSMVHSNKMLVMMMWLVKSCCRHALYLQGQVHAQNLLCSTATTPFLWSDQYCSHHNNYYRQLVSFSVCELTFSLVSRTDRSPVIMVIWISELLVLE